MKRKKFHPNICVDAKNKMVTIYLENCAFYGEWIPSESADIAIYRAVKDNRVVGTRLPLRVWNGKFPITVL